MPAPLCSTYLPSGRGSAWDHPLPHLGHGSLRSGFLSCLNLRSAHRLLWRSCVISGALGGDVFGSYVLGSGLVQEAAPALGKPVSVRRAGKSGAKQMSVLVLIRVSGSERGLTVCVAPAGPELAPVKLIH